MKLKPFKARGLDCAIDHLIAADGQGQNVVTRAAINLSADVADAAARAEGGNKDIVTVVQPNVAVDHA